jgi:hypothetical protein
MKIMRILSFLLLTVIAMSFGQYSYAQNSGETYCNNRFGFCITYPSSIQADKSGATNGDGLILKHNTAPVTVNISGSHNVMDWTPEKIFTFTKEDFSYDTDSPVTVVSSDVNEGGFESIIKAGDQMQHTRMWVINNDYLLISIDGPSDKEQLIDQLWNDVIITFNNQ